MALPAFNRLCRYFAAALLLCLGSCVVPHNMYVPPALNAPVLTQKGESSVNAAISHRGFDLQGGYALSDHFAVIGSWYQRWQTRYDTVYHHTDWGGGVMEVDSFRYKRNLFSLGAVYFTTINKGRTRFFMFSAGYGVGNFRFLSHSHPTPNRDTTNNYPPFHYNATMSRVFVQPAIMDHNGEWAAIFSVRWAGTFYYHVRASTNLNPYGTISNRLLSFVEPALTINSAPIVKGLRINLQLGASFNNSEIDYDYSPIIGNIGLDIDPVKLFGKKSNSPPKTF